MKRLAILLISVVITTGFLFSASDFKMIKNLSVSNGESYPYSIMSMGGSVTIAPQGKIQGSLIIIGGTLKLEGMVTEDVFCVASTVALGEKSHIQGDLYVIGGSLVPADKMTVEKKVAGQYLNFKFNFKKIESTLMPILSDTQTFALFKLIKIVFWAIIALIVFAVVPRKIILAEEIFTKHLLKIGTIGFISIFSFVFLMFIFIILSFVFIGIPFLFILVIGYFVVYVFGRTALFYFIGLKLSQRFKIKISPAFFIIIGVGLYAILKFIPVVGPLLLIVMNIFEVGIGVGYFFRKKLRLQG